MDLKSNNFVAVLKIDSSGRAGKTVTVIDGLPKIALFLEGLTKFLKQRCGSGGTFSLEGKEGRIEIQGDKRELVASLLAEKGIRTKTL